MEHHQFTDFINQFRVIEFITKSQQAKGKKFDVQDSLMGHPEVNYSDDQKWLNQKLVEQMIVTNCWI